ncbi:MAG: putative lipid II flippase FtsW [Candidatus Omnitrophica bacterium]|nr:putative lipid II flippase FtsW [Candidatus Omnitrophota bacterium]
MVNGEIFLKKPSWPLYRKLTALILALTGLGVVMVANTTFVFAGQKYGNPYFFVKKEILWAALGFIAFIFAQKIDLNNLRRFSRPILLTALFLLIAVLVFGKEINGAKRWLGIGPFSFQPSELFKIAVILYLADFLDRKNGKILDPRRSFVPPGLLIGLGMVLMLKEPDLGTVILLAAIVIIFYFIADAPLKYLSIMIVTVIVGGGLMMWLEPFRRARLLAFLNPWGDTAKTSYHISQSLIGVGNGGLFGVGLGQGCQKLFYLPEGHTDFIFANIAEELGFFGSTFFIALFLFLFHWGMQTAKRTPDRFRSLLAAGITALIGLQAISHISVVISLLPTKGITLPFISYGGSSLLFTLFASGLLVNIARNLPPDDFRI